MDVPPALEAQLAPLAEQCGCGSTALSAAVARLDGLRQQGVLGWGTAVAAWLRSKGIEEAQMARLVVLCPLLFSWPAEQRAVVLFGQLLGLGLSAAQAARCFERRPLAATSPSFEPAIGVLAELFAAGSQSSAPAEQLVGSFLRKQPAAVALLKYGAEALQERIDGLLGLGLSRAQLVAAAQRSWGLLTASPARLAALASVLQQELGGGRDLLAKLVHRDPRAATCSLEVMRARAQALLQASWRVSLGRAACSLSATYGMSLALKSGRR